jgi:hypothetical protein
MISIAFGIDTVGLKLLGCERWEGRVRWCERVGWGELKQQGGRGGRGRGKGMFPRLNLPNWSFPSLDWSGW